MHYTTFFSRILLPSTVLVLASCTSPSEEDTSATDTASTSTTQGSSTSDTGTSSAGTDSETSTDSDGVVEDFIIEGVSGELIILDRRWDRGCIGTEGSWNHSERTLTGLELVTTLTDYENGSVTPDCATGAVQITTFTQILTNDQHRLPIVWVDAEGNESAPPPGLEAVTEQHGASGLMTVATVTPLGSERAELLNLDEFCGATDWTADVAHDVVDCFTWGVNPAKGTLIVDDTVTPWRVYDGIAEDPSEYPTLLPNYAPHEGPFE